jgi:hypothetical protein
MLGGGQQVVIAADAAKTAHLLLARIDQEGATWYLGPVDHAGGEEFIRMSADHLLGARPDLAAVLKLPGGFMTVIGTRGVDVVFDSSNQNMLRSP